MFLGYGLLHLLSVYNLSSTMIQGCWVKVSAVKSGVSRRNVSEIEKFNTEPEHQVQNLNTARGRRTVRKRRTDVGVNNKLAGHMGNAMIHSESFQSLNEENWGGGKAAMELNGFDNSNTAEAAESEDDNLSKQGNMMAQKLGTNVQWSHQGLEHEFRGRDQRYGS